MIKYGKITIMLLAVIALATGCGKKTEEAKAVQVQGIPVFTAEARQGAISDKIHLSGAVIPYEMVNVFSKAPGKIAKFAVEEGSRVKVDDVIAYIDRDEPGFDFTAAPVKSPAKGIVIKKYLDVGTTVTPGSAGAAMATPIVSVGDISKLKIIVNVVEEDIGRVKIGQDADINFDAFPGEIFRGKVSTISPSADSLSHTSKVEILLDNKAGRIKAGLSADVSLIVGKALGVVIPRDSVIMKTGEIFVFAIKNGFAEKRVVVTGFDDGTDIQITVGVAAGEKIAASDFNVLQNGLRVKDSGALKN